MNEVTVNPTSAQASVTLIPGLSGQSIRINAVYISVDTAMEVTLEDAGASNAVKFGFHGGANGGVVVELPKPIILTEGAALDYTTETGEAHIIVWFEQA